MLYHVLFSSDEEDNIVENRRRRKVYKPRINFNFQYDADFYEKFRMSPAAAEGIIRIIGYDLSFHNKGGALTPPQQLCLTLHWLGTGCQYHAIALCHGVHKSTVARTIRRVVRVVNRRLFQRTVAWPENIADEVDKFYRVANFPCVTGIVDGCLITIDAPSVNEELYVDRKGKHSLNCMFVCGSRCQFFYVSANWPGSLHDARVLRNSNLYRRMEERNIFPNGVLLGDSGYPLKEWLMTPFHNDPNHAGERRYNRRLKATRQLIECALGILKEKFPCLNHLRVEPVFAANIVKCCAVFCNIARQNEDAPPLGNQAIPLEEPLAGDVEHQEVAAIQRQQEIIQSMM